MRRVRKNGSPAMKTASTRACTNAANAASIALSVLATSLVVTDGESNWVEGLQLLSVYLILALAFYFVPGPH